MATPAQRTNTWILDQWYDQSVAGTTGGYNGNFELWGAGWNYKGMLGQNSIRPAPSGGYSSPIQIPGTTWSNIESNGAYALAIKTDNTLWAWGTNEAGELGQNENNEPGYSSPVQIPGSWSEVDCTTADRVGGVKTDGTLWTWGPNTQGQSGRPSQPYNSPRSSPTQVGSDTTWSDMEMGDFTCMGLKTDGSLWVWGRAEYGSLGQNSPDVNQSSPVQVSGTWSGSQISSDYNGCVVKSDGTLWVWGPTAFGNLGLNKGNYSEPRSSPTQIPGTWKQADTEVDLMGGIKTDGTLWMWGRNNDGACGINKSSDSQAGCSSPTQVPGSNWAALSLQGATALATKTDGTMWNWGMRAGGRLGNNTNTYFSSPVQVPGTDWSTDKKKIAAGGQAHYYIKEF